MLTPAQNLPKSLQRSAKVKPRHKWQDLADLIIECGIMDFSASGLTVPLADGSRKVHVDGGWTGAHYHFLAPLLEPWDKAGLARVVLEGELARAGCEELHTAWCLLRKNYSANEEEWLPELVEVEGFTAVAVVLARAVTEYRVVNPRRRFVVDVAGRRVSWKDQDYQVTEEQALFLALLHKNLGKAPLTEQACINACPRLAGGHFRRNFWKKLPKPLREITRSQRGYGWWLELD
jgi:hypothetical protein